MDWFLYDISLRHEKVKAKNKKWTETEVNCKQRNKYYLFCQFIFTVSQNILNKVKRSSSIHQIRNSAQTPEKTDPNIRPVEKPEPKHRTTVKQRWRYC